MTSVDSNTLGTEVFDAEVEARVAAMRAELAGVEELMRSTVKIDLSKVSYIVYLFRYLVCLFYLSCLFVPMCERMIDLISFLQRFDR